MAFYPREIQERCDSPKNRGTSGCDSAAGRAANFCCGCVVNFALNVEVGSGTIKNAGFTSNGCGYMIASADILAETVKGKQLGNLHGLKNALYLEQLRSRLGQPPCEREDCFTASLEAVQNAFADLRERRIQEFRGEQALVCTCFGVSEETVENIVVGKNAKTVQDVSRACNAGLGCGSCRMLIQEIIDSGSD